MQKKAQLEAEAKAAEAMADVARDVHDALAEISEEVASPPSRAGAAFNGAYLVREASRAAFMERVDQLGRRHGEAFTCEVTGPWPPYNFTSADVSGPVVAAR